MSAENRPVTAGGITLSVSVVNRNGKSMLERCLESIVLSTRRTRYEIVVVDNGSIDGSPEMVRSRFPDITLVVNETPKGYGASHNQAFKVSRGRFFLALNNDVIVRDGALDTMCERLARSNGIGVLGCRLLNANGTLQISCAHDSNFFRMMASDFVPKFIPLEKVGLREWMKEWKHDAERSVDLVQGSCMMIPRETIERVGLFDEQFLFFREEYDFCRRVRATGLKVVYTPFAEIVHLGGQTMKLDRETAYRTYLESRFKYFRKHEGIVVAQLVLLSAFSGVILRLFVSAAAIVLPGQIGAKARQKLRLFAGVAGWFFGRERPWTFGR